jgi:hypothetical protein
LKKEKMSAARKIDDRPQHLARQKLPEEAPVEGGKEHGSTSCPGGRTLPSTADGHTPTHEDWRDLARQIQAETDPNKMIDLVQQLVNKFDEERLRKSLRPGPKA